MKKKIPLKTKILELFDATYPESTSLSEIMESLNKRGKVDSRKLFQLVVLLIEELE